MGMPCPPANTWGLSAARAWIDAWAALEFQVVYQGGPERPLRPSRRLATVSIFAVTSASPLISTRSAARNRET
jgi:hypothetical protein